MMVGTATFTIRIIIEMRTGGVTNISKDGQMIALKAAFRFFGKCWEMEIILERRWGLCG
jgi:hypothetical protein